MRTTLCIIFLIFWSIGVWAEAPQLLSQTGLYENMQTGKIAESNLYFEPQYPLWTDGAKKARWIYLPPGKQIENGKTTPLQGSPDRWIFPVGTKAWKEFSFPDPENPGHYKKVETRYYRKSREDGWFAATYVWNDAQTDAAIAPLDGIANHYPLGGNKFHSIPAVRECWQCHYKGGDALLGFEALQLSTDRDPLGLHTHNAVANSVTLRTLIEKNLLTQSGTLLTHPPRIHSSTETGRAAMGYLHGNCGHCHNPAGTAADTGQFLRHVLSATSQEEEPAFHTTVGVYTQDFQIPGVDETYRVLPQVPESSAVHYRLRKGSMPPLGFKRVDTKAAELLENWIRSLTE